MNKLVLTAFLLCPVLVVAGLYFAIPKNPKDRLFTASRPVALHAADPLKDAADRMKKAGAEAAANAAQAAKDAAGKAGAQAADSALKIIDGKVRPEFLPQGYIMIVTDSAGLSSQDSPVFLASSYNGWNPGDEGSKMTRRSDLRWQIVMKPGKTDAPIAFKFTRGSWDLEELSEALAPVDNRNLPAVEAAKYADGKTQPIFEFTVVKWGDQKPSGAARPDLNPYFTLKTPNIVRLEVAGGVVAPFKRDLFVWTPPGYNDPANATRTYPVLYMHDGQNIFEAHPSVPAEWGVDETAAKLIAAGAVEPMIIVGIPHAGKARASEYMPFENKRLGDTKPMGDWYANWLVSDVMPRVERAFRVKTGRENTVVGGSSLGGIISLHIASLHPDKFRGVLCESIAPLGEENPTLAFLKTGKGVKNMDVFYGYGLREGNAEKAEDPMNEKYNKTFKDTAAWLEQQGQHSFAVKATDQPHNEIAWAERFPDALKALFPAKKN